MQFICGPRANTSFECDASHSCDNLWIASQDVGSATTFLLKKGKAVKPEDVHVGDEVSAATDINIRSGPANWQQNEFVLRKGQSAVIVELRLLTADDGEKQLWVRIKAPEDSDDSRGKKPTTPRTDHDGKNPPKAPVEVNTCWDLPVSNEVSAVPVITPPVSSIPPSPGDVERLLEGREIFCDQYGLIVHKDANGKFNGGDTAQREGWYWFGVWLRANTSGLSPWDRKRRLNFDQVLDLLEPGHDGVFYRHPKQSPYNNPFDKEWGFSRDQMIPLVAAMGVWGKQDIITRLWNALPEDALGKKSFNGNWRNLLGQDGPNCGDILKRDCSPTDVCTLNVDARDCSLQVDSRNCSLQVDNRDCSANEDTRNCEGNPIAKGYCEAQKAAQNAGYATAKASCEAQKAAQNAGYAAAKASCETAKATQNAAYASVKASCETQKVTQNGIYAADKASCEAAKTAKKFACEADKAAANQLCRFTNVYSGDIIGPSTVNLFLRALNKDPLIPDWSTFLPTKILNGGLAGEGELYAEQHIIVGKTWDNKDETGDDLNNIVMLIMSRLRFPSAISEQAVNVYIQQRRDSYGSYLGEYYSKFGDDMKDLRQRIDRGIAEGWKPDVSAPAGAVRWYHRPDTGANPQLGTLYIPVIGYYLK